jgi:hypothetical protein
MSGALDPFRFVLIADAGWMNHVSYRSKGQGVRTQTFVGGGHHCDARNLARLTSQTDRRKYDGSGKRGPGRRRTADEIETLVIRMTEENREWGYRHVQGALSNLGHEIARSTIAEVIS